jgi:H+/Cl- antiporter ClcA
MSDPPRPRWFSHQPNVTGVGIVAAYGPQFWLLVVAIGVISGAAASLLVALLKLVQRLAYGTAPGGYVAAVKAAPASRHLAVLLLAAAIVVVGLTVLGNMRNAGGTEVSESLWLRRGRLALVPSIARGVLSIVTVGMGVSLGREGAPQLTAAATASRLADWAAVPLWQRRLLVASGAGAGFAAVYNVPLGGTLLALEVLLGTLALPLALPALMTSVIATAVAWLTLGTRPAFFAPSYPVHGSQIVWAAVFGPLIGLLAIGWTQLIRRASLARPEGALKYVVPFAVFGALALLSVPYPQLLGNGKDIVQLAILGKLSIGLLAALFVLKPLATAGCLGSGSPGGLFMPTFAVGTLLAGLLGTAWAHVWHGSPIGAYSLVGGGAFLAASMQGPLAGTVLALELTGHFNALVVPTLVAVVEATVVARLLGASSIYSARLPEDPEFELRPAASAAAIATLHALDDSLPDDVTGPPAASTRRGAGYGRKPGAEQQARGRSDQQAQTTGEQQRVVDRVRARAGGKRRTGKTGADRSAQQPPD